jgi:hypothetical protein
LSYQQDKQLHHDLAYVGLRAQATAAGLLQLSIELRKAGVIDDAAICRIKNVITKEIALQGPRSMTCEAQEKEIRARIDRLFEGREQIGAANAVNLAAYDNGPNAPVINAA